MNLKTYLVIIFYTAVLFLDFRCSVSGAHNITEPRFIEYLENESNTTRTIDLQANPQLDVLKRVGVRDPNAYLLYTRSNPKNAHVLFTNLISSVLESNYNPSDQVVVIVHGWMQDRKSRVNSAIKDAFLAMVYANVIVVEWSKVAQSSYVTASTGVPHVGRSLGRFLEFLNVEAGASYTTMHLIGFGLGAHVVGKAGKFLKGRVSRITGLDPAAPLWLQNPDRLSSANAVYVEAIHTDREMLGTTTRSGHVDFYPNGGNTQPGCVLIESSCSHHRAWQLFVATVTYDHLVGRRCQSDLLFDLDACFGSRLHMGNDDLLKKGNGKYRLKTVAEYPYPQIS